MRIIACGFINDISVEVIYRAIREFDVEFCEYYYDVPNRIPDLCRAVGHHYLPVQLSADYGVDWNTITPLDEALVERMACCETVVLRMMDRIDLWAPLSYSERKRLYLKHLRYWNHSIIRHRFDLCLFSGVPHGNFDYVLYELCRLHKVHILMFTCPSLILDTLFITDDFEEPSIELRNRYAELRRLRASGTLGTFALSESFQRLLETQSSRQKDPIPFYMQPQALADVLQSHPSPARSVIRKLGRALTNPAAALPRIGSLTTYAKQAVVRGVERVHERDAAQKLSSFYKMNASNPNLDATFIYLPLQLQPECTTSPMGGGYVDQLLMVQLLASTIPAGAYLYLKEHPVQAGYGLSGRDIEFYRELLQIPPVRLVPTEQSTFRLIERCVAVAAVTGTAGWEGLFWGKPYLMFGHHVYQYAPGVLTIRTREDCAQAIRAVFEQGYAPDLEDLRLFLKAVEDVAIIANTVASRQAASPLTPDQNVENLTRALLTRIRSLDSPRQKSKSR